MLPFVEVYLLLELALVVASGFIATVAWANRDRPAGWPLCALAVAATLYVVADAGTTVVSRPAVWRVLTGLQYALTAGIAVAGFVFAGELTRMRVSRRPVVTIPLYGFVAASTAFAVTDPFHRLMVGQRRVVDGVAVASNGPLFWANTILSLLVVLGAVVVLASTLASARGRYREQLAAALSGLLLGILFFLWEVLASIHPTFNLATVGVFCWCLVTTWAVLRVDFLETVPLARRTLMEHLNEAVLALDRDETLVDYNRSARERLAIEPGDVGEPITDVLSEYPGILESVCENRNTTVRALTDGGERHLEVDTTPVYDDRSGAVDDPARSPVGRMVIVRDVTTQLRRERGLQHITERLEEQRDTLEMLNHLVRHDIRNKLQTVQLYGELLEDAVDEDCQEHLQTLLRNAESAADITETARGLSGIVLDETQAPRPTLLEEHLRPCLETVRANHPDVTFRIEGSVAGVHVLATDMLEAVFRNLLVNGAKHNDSDDPEVVVSVTEQEETVRVRVADNGPGIPDDEKETVFGRGERGLESEGTGLGLYFVQSLVENYGGSVWVEDNEPRGAVFVLELPSGD